MEAVLHTPVAVSTLWELDAVTQPCCDPIRDFVRSAGKA